MQSPIGRDGTNVYLARKPMSCSLSGLKTWAKSLDIVSISLKGTLKAKTRCWTLVVPSVIVSSSGLTWNSVCLSFCD